MGPLGKLLLKKKISTKFKMATTWQKAGRSGIRESI